MVMVIYREAFTRFDLGCAAALSVVLLVVLVALNTPAAARARAPSGEAVVKPSKAGYAAFYVTGPRSRCCSCSRWCGAAAPPCRGSRGRARRRLRVRQLPGDGALRRGPATYLTNTAIVSGADRARHARRVGARRLRLRPLQLPRQEPAVPGHAGDPDGPVRDDPDPALRRARRLSPAELAGRPEPGADHVPAPVRAVHDAQRVRGAAARARGGGARRRLRAPSGAAAGSCCTRCARR